MTTHTALFDPAQTVTGTIRTPAELVDALPYLLGYRPGNSIVLVGLHGGRGRFGARLRADIPDDPRHWAALVPQLVEQLLRGGGAAGEVPDGALAYLCREPQPPAAPPAPASGGTPPPPRPAPDTSARGGRAVFERLRPLADLLGTACRRHGLTLREALCVSGDRWWSYLCTDPACCPPQGAPLLPEGSSEVAAAATFAGIAVRGDWRQAERDLLPLSGPRADAQCTALDRAAIALVPRILSADGVQALRAETLRLARAELDRIRSQAPGEPVRGSAAGPEPMDPDVAARLVIGLQDKTARDRAAGWFEPPDQVPARLLWTELARRCVHAYEDHAVAPLSLVGWVAWAAGDELAARVALHRALLLEPEYTFARLLHQAINAGTGAEGLRGVLRRHRERWDRAAPPSAA